MKKLRCWAALVVALSMFVVGIPSASANQVSNYSEAAGSYPQDAYLKTEPAFETEPALETQSPAEPQTQAQSGSQSGSQNRSQVSPQVASADVDTNLGLTTGVELGSSGTVATTTQAIDQQAVYAVALQTVVKWRQDALNDTRITFEYKGDQLPIREYLVERNIPESVYLNPQWSYDLELIALQRAIEAYDYSIAHTRPNGELCFSARANGVQSQGEILAWGYRSMEAAIDGWASEKEDYVKELADEPHDQTGHYTNLVDPENKFYGFAGASAYRYGTSWSGESRLYDSGSSKNPTNLRGTFDFSVKVNDTKLAEGLTMTVPNAQILQGTTQQPTVKLNYMNGRYQLAAGHWKSSNTAVAEVDQSGVITGKSAGTTTITVTAQNQSVSTEIQVVPVQLFFDGNGANSGSIAPIQGGVGQQITLPSNSFENSGQAFIGWNTRADGSGQTYQPGDQFTFGSQDVTLYAQWNSQTFTVTFNSNGGSSVDAQVVAAGSKATMPKAPQRVGYTFVGWFTSKLGGSQYDFSQAVTKNLTLYARWTQKSYTVTFDSVYGSPVASQTVAHGKTATPPATPTRYGYIFQGWFTAKAGGKKFDFFSTPVTSDLTLYAHWESKFYTVTFDSNGGSAVETQSVQHGAKVKVPTQPTRKGYVFVGWSTAVNSNKLYDFSELVYTDMTLYAQWSVETFVVTFDSNGGTTVANQTVTSGSTVAAPQSPTHFGYTFAGWFTAANGGTKFDFSTPITGDLTLYAHWTINTYTVKFDSNGGSAVNSKTVDHGKTVTAPKSPTRTGYTFAGWFTARTGGMKYDFSKPITSDLNLFAHWTPNQYVVTFDSNGGSAVSAQTVEYQKTVAVPKAPVRTGYTFVGWFTAMSGGAQYDFAQPVTADLMLYAHWTINTYTVTFDSNGGSLVKPQSVEYNKTVAAPKDPTRIGRIFAGWFTQKTAGEKYDFTKPVAGNLTLYAHWDRLVFTDVVQRDANTEGTPHADHVQWMADAGLANGYSNGDGTYRYEGMTPVYRQDMAAFLRRLAVYENIGDAATWQPSEEDWKAFNDVTPATPHAEDILWLSHSGISVGWPSKQGGFEFRPMSNIKRQDMAAFLKRIADKAGKSGGVTARNIFDDVNKSTPHYDEIIWLAGSGISTGWVENGRTEFRGMNDVVRQDMAAFMHRLDDLLRK
ncbi:internalin [Bifidobacterium dolichotidis]|uniref:Internalin n=1 Tax=Bifidobacterium dolichotidis TaxID=2306976 RepID=A0A430FKG5_9BIFI|nr:InlB B-repeat-containing protein [Bifidobacterium dolichotidis]RSX53379.1 internalin [Bifidobacterium dolichotidis]